MDLALTTVASGWNRMDQLNAWRMDQVLQWSEQTGIRLMITAESFTTLSPNLRFFGDWYRSAYNAANGGPLKEPAEYFASAEIAQLWRDRLRYMVARWGYSSSVMSWELWNEMDGTGLFDAHREAAWHRDTIRYLRQIDPWDHPVGTSLGHPAGYPELDNLKEPDFVQTHCYNARDLARELGYWRDKKTALVPRPHLVGEFSIDARAGHSLIQTDPAGVHLRNALYASVGQQQAGAPLSWWWDNYLDPGNLYPLYAAFSRWIEGFDFVAQRPRPLRASVAYDAPDGPRAQYRWSLQPVEHGWAPGPECLPATLDLAATGECRPPAPLSCVMHGLGGHANLHNPVTFVADLPETATFAVTIGGVSGHGGARLLLALDGRTERQEVFDDPDGQSGVDLLTQYAGTYTISVPPGRRHVTVENTGTDWLEVKEYGMTWRPRQPPLRVLGLMGRTRGLVWVQNLNHTWPAATAKDYAPSPVEGALLVLDAVPPGRWRLELWDTQAGSVLHRGTVRVGDSGQLRVPLPSIATDAAFRMERLGPRWRFWPWVD
jgi:hypothetical protein